MAEALGASRVGTFLEKDFQLALQERSGAEAKVGRVHTLLTCLGMHIIAFCLSPVVRSHCLYQHVLGRRCLTHLFSPCSHSECISLFLLFTTTMTPLMGLLRTEVQTWLIRVDAMSPNSGNMILDQASKINSLLFPPIYFKVALIYYFLCSRNTKHHETASTWQNGTWGNLALCFIPWAIVAQTWFQNRLAHIPFEERAVFCITIYKSHT